MTTSRSTLAALLVGAALLLPRPAAALFEDDEARKAILDLRARVDVMSRDYAAQLRELAERVERLEQRSRGQLEIQNQIEAMRQEIAALRGRVEEQTNELAKTQREQRDMVSNIDTRIRKFEPVQVVIDGKPATVDQNERRAFEAALAEVRAGDFRNAQTSFRAFSAQYPDSAYAASAAFWLGSSQFALRDYKGAISTHQALLAKYPESPRAPDSMLNLAYAQIESGDKRGGRKTLETLVERYPSAGAAQAARDRLAALR